MGGRRKKEIPLFSLYLRVQLPHQREEDKTFAQDILRWKMKEYLTN